MTTETVYVMTGWTARRSRRLHNSTGTWQKMQIPSEYGSWEAACRIAAETQGIDALDFITEQEAILYGIAKK